MLGLDLTIMLRLDVSMKCLLAQAEGPCKAVNTASNIKRSLALHDLLSLTELYAAYNKLSKSIYLKRKTAQMLLP